MIVRVNDEPVALDGPVTLTELLAHLGYGEALVAVAVDGVFVPRAQHARTMLADGARIEIVAPMAGG